MLPEYIKYHHSVLSDIKKDVYRQMYEGFRARKSRFGIKVDKRYISADELWRIATYVLYDTPSFYYVDPSGYRCWSTRDGYDFEPASMYDDATINRYDEVIRRGIDSFRSQAITPDMGEYEREMAIHDYLVSHLTYDYEACEALERTDSIAGHTQAFDVVGVLRDHKAVCLGIAKAFKLLCDACQVKCLVVSGRGMESSPDKPGHAWNMVKLDGRSYHVDVTWDLRKKGDIRFCYDYLNLPDQLMGADHDWDGALYPRCDALEYNYYRRNGLYVRSLKDIASFIEASVRDGKQNIAMKFANPMPEDTDIVQQVVKGLAAARYYQSYRYLIARDTHNIYVDLQGEATRTS